MSGIESNVVDTSGWVVVEIDATMGAGSARDEKGAEGTVAPKSIDDTFEAEFITGSIDYPELNITQYTWEEITAANKKLNETRGGRGVGGNHKVFPIEDAQKKLNLPPQKKLDIRFLDETFRLLPLNKQQELKPYRDIVAKAIRKIFFDKLSEQQQKILKSLGGITTHIAKMLEWLLATFPNYEKILVLNLTNQAKCKIEFDTNTKDYIYVVNLPFLLLPPDDPRLTTGRTHDAAPNAYVDMRIVADSNGHQKTLHQALRVRSGLMPLATQELQKETSHNLDELQIKAAQEFILLALDEQKHKDTDQILSRLSDFKPKDASPRTQPNHALLARFNIEALPSYLNIKLSQLNENIKTHGFTKGIKEFLVTVLDEIKKFISDILTPEFIKALQDKTKDSKLSLHQVIAKITANYISQVATKNKENSSIYNSLLWHRLFKNLAEDVSSAAGKHSTSDENCSAQELLTPITEIIKVLTATSSDEKQDTTSNNSSSVISNLNSFLSTANDGQERQQREAIWIVAEKIVTHGVTDKDDDFFKLLLEEADIKLCLLGYLQATYRNATQRLEPQKIYKNLLDFFGKYNRTGINIEYPQTTVELNNTAENTQDTDARYKIEGAWSESKKLAQQNMLNALIDNEDGLIMRFCDELRQTLESIETIENSREERQPSKEPSYIVRPETTKFEDNNGEAVVTIFANIVNTSDKTLVCKAALKLTLSPDGKTFTHGSPSFALQNPTDKFAQLYQNWSTWITHTLSSNKELLFIPPKVNETEKPTPSNTTQEAKNDTLIAPSLTRSVANQPSSSSSYGNQRDGTVVANHSRRASQATTKLQSNLRFYKKAGIFLRGVAYSFLGLITAGFSFYWLGKPTFTAAAAEKEKERFAQEKQDDRLAKILKKKALAEAALQKSNVTTNNNATQPSTVVATAPLTNPAVTPTTVTVTTTPVTAEETTSEPQPAPLVPDNTTTKPDVHRNSAARIISALPRPHLAPTPASRASTATSTTSSNTSVDSLDEDEIMSVKDMTSSTLSSATNPSSDRSSRRMSDVSTCVTDDTKKDIDDFASSDSESDDEFQELKKQTSADESKTHKIYTKTRELAAQILVASRAAPTPNPVTSTVATLSPIEDNRTPTYIM